MPLGQKRKINYKENLFIYEKERQSVFFSPVREKNQKITKRINLPAANIILKEMDYDITIK